MPAFVSTLAFRLIAAGVIVFLLLFAMKSCSGSQQKVAQATQDARSATATAETAQDAARVVIERGASDMSVDSLVRETAKEIDNAATPQDAGRAARSAICSLPNYSADAACKLR